MIEHAAALALIAVVFVLRYRQIYPRVTKDCDFYLNMAHGKRAPKPYCYRVLVPYVARMFRTPETALRRIALTGTALLPFVVYAVTLKLSGSTLAATAAALVLIGTDSLVGFSIMVPFLVDSWALVFAGLAFLAPDPVSCAVALVLAALTKEIGYVLGAAFVVVTMPVLWPVAVPGFVALCVLRIARRPASTECPWILRPFKTAIHGKRRVWFDYGRALSGMKATPWIAAAFLPVAECRVAAFVVIAIAAAQTFVGLDHGRLVAMSCVFVVPVVAVAVPEWVLAPWALVSIFWPFNSREWI